MRDGRTRKLPIPAADVPEDSILRKHRISLVVLDGKWPGDEFILRGSRTIFGRGPSVDIAVPDSAMSRQHFSLEVAGDAIRLRDLGSTNGVTVNGTAVESVDLAHGDRVKAGDHVFQFLIERVEREPRTYVVNG